MESGHEPMDNPERGCGHLQHGKAYFTGGGFSEGGVLPSWVEIDPHLPFREVGTQGEFTRGFVKFDSLTLQLALHREYDFIPHYPNEDDLEDGEAESKAMRNHVDAGVYDSFDEVPTDQVQRHIDRVGHRGTEGGKHWGDIPVAGTTDYLMRAGKTYYPTPESYIGETIEHGLSKAISIRKNNIPQVVPGITRCWVMHPKACEGYGGGIIGFAYLNEITFTLPEEGELPTYVREGHENGHLTVRDIKEPQEPNEEEAEEDTPDASISDFETATDE